MNATNANARHVPITVLDVGTRPNNFPEGKTTEIRFHGFDELDTTRGVSVSSPEFSCFGHQWSLRLYPGGNSTSNEGMVAICLCHLSNQEISVKYGFYVGGVGTLKSVEKWRGESKFFLSENFRGCKDFAEYSTITTDYLVEHALVVEVKMKLIGSTSKTPLPFIPDNPLSKNILKKFMDETTADVVFEVSCESKGENGSKKRAKTSPSTFYAHRLILTDSAPTLAELCKIGGEMAPVKITDVKPDIFRHILHYVYGGTLPKEDLESHAKDIIDAADKYGAVNLKLEAEACYVRSTAITMDNVIDNLMYADSKNCALLKEAVMDFLVENGGEAVEKLSFLNIPGYIVKDLLTAMHMGKQQDKNDASDYSTMRVSTLRSMLHEKGLDVDGSREAMIALLKENS